MSKFKRYERYKGSGVEWIGEIPEHWDITKLGYRARMIVPMRDKPTEFNGNIPWIRIEDVDGKYIEDSKSEQRVSEELVKKMNLKVYPIGTVLCTCSCNMGTTVIVKKPLISNQTFIGIVPMKDLDSTFLYYAMNANSKRLQHLAEGAIQQYLSRHDFEHLKLAFPDKKEQTAIANFLDQKTAEIDGLITDKEKLIELLQEKRQAVITEAVTKGLNPNVRMKDSGIEWIGEIPEHWELNKLKYVIRNGKEGIKIGPFGSSLKLDDMDESNPYKVYGQENIINNDFTRGNRFITQEKFNEMCGYQLFSGDIVISMMGTIGKCKVIPLGIQPGIMDSHLIRLRTNNGVMLPKFLEYLIDNTNYVKEQMNYMSKGSIMSGLNSSIIKEIILVIPSVVEQKEIIDFLEQKTAEIDDLVTKIKIQIQKLKEYRQSLISEAVTGKIDVRDCTDK